MEYILCIYVILFIFLLDYLMKPKHRNVLPYRIPIIGHVFLFMYNDVHKTLSYWSQNVGSNYAIQIFHIHIVVLSSYEDIYEMMVTKGKETGGRVLMFRTNYMFKDGIIFSDYSNHWKKQRNFVHQHLKQYGEGFGQIQQIVLLISRDLSAMIREKASMFQAFDPYDDVYMAIVSTLTSLMTGSINNHNDEEFQVIKELSRLLLEGVSFNEGFDLDLFPFLRYFGHKTFKKCKAYLEKEEQAWEIITRKLNTGNGDKSHSLAYTLMDNRNEVNSQSILTIFSDILSAGINTSTASLYCFMQIMAQNKEKQKKLYNEINSILSKYKKSEITLEYRNEMPYARACLLELQRFVSVVPIAAPHKILVDTEIGGQLLKKETIVIANLWQLHHDITYWENPWEFQPERFLDDDGNMLPSNHINRKRLLAFGAGTRVCIGQTLAVARLFIFTTNLIREFEIINNGDNQNDPQKYGFDAIVIHQKYPLSFITRK